MMQSIMKKKRRTLRDKEELPDVAPLSELAIEDVCDPKEPPISTLKKIFPGNLLSPDKGEKEGALSSLLPYFTYTPLKHAPYSISFYLVTEYEKKSFRFFYDMISKWLMPGHFPFISFIASSNFTMPSLCNKKISLSEIRIDLPTPEEAECLQRNLPIIEKEIRLGLLSSYYAQRIQELKGLGNDAKNLMIQEQIAKLIEKFPKFLSPELFAEMQRLLVTFSESFKKNRECRHLERIIIFHYLFRKELQKMVDRSPKKRHLIIKIFPALIATPLGQKPILAISIAINFFQNQEVFEERHLINAIQSYIPNAKSVEHSFHSNRKRDENISALYLELEKENREEFSAKERLLLQNKLPSDLKDHIEYLHHPIFMPRNEEEIMRNILLLSNQIKYIDDVPQVVISFDKQTNSDLFFNVIVVHLKKPDSPTIHELFKKAKTSLGYIPDRSKTTGMLRKYEKEAVVFFLKLSVEQFLRKDHSIDLNRARQTVFNELSRIIGEVRDFNGGMISKQHEAFQALRIEMKDLKFNEMLLENFFYSLTPDVMRTVLDSSLLKELYLFIFENLDIPFFTSEKYGCRVRTRSDCVFTIIKTEDKGLREYLGRAVRKFRLNQSLLSGFVVIYDLDYISYLFLSEDSLQQEAFCYFIQTALLLRDPKPHSPYGELIRPDYED